MRIAIITDVHANLPALKAVLQAIGEEGTEAIFCTGDAIAIGPYPGECLELLLDADNARFTMGNHEAYFVDGLPTRRPAWMSEGEAQHQLWTHSRIEPGMRLVLGEWPYVLEHDFEGVKTVFVHYGLDPSGRGFQPVIKDTTAADLDRMFARHGAALFFYGHDHRQSDVMGRARYVNPGALGCNSRPVARYCVAEFRRGHYRVEHRSVPYDDAELLRAFEQRKVPARKFIYHAFYGDRFRTAVEM